MWKKSKPKELFVGQKQKLYFELYKVQERIEKIAGKLLKIEDKFLLNKRFNKNFEILNDCLFDLEIFVGRNT